MFSLQVNEKDVIREIFFSLLLNKCNHTPAIPDSKVITTAKRNGTAIPTIGNSVYKETKYSTIRNHNGYPLSGIPGLGQKQLPTLAATTKSQVIQRSAFQAKPKGMGILYASEKRALLPETTFFPQRQSGLNLPALLSASSGILSKSRTYLSVARANARCRSSTES